jgi:UDP-N-acetyl-D-glucosamine dehydrogenase
MIRPTREHSHWAGLQSVTWNRSNISGYHLTLIATNHASVNYQELADWAPAIVDTRNAMTGIVTQTGQVYKA